MGPRALQTGVPRVAGLHSLERKMWICASIKGKNDQNVTRSTELFGRTETE